MSVYSNALEKACYSIFDYSGHLRNAPQKFKHIFRDLQPGRYLVHETKGPLNVPGNGIGPFNTNTPDPQLWYAAALSWAVSEGLVFLGAPDDSGLEAFPVTSLHKVPMEIRRKVIANYGWFAYDIERQNFVYETGAQTMEELLGYLTKGTPLGLETAILTVSELFARVERLQVDLAEVAEALSFLI